MLPITITFDLPQRDRTLAERGLDFADATGILSGPRIEFEDLRVQHDEQRFVTVGHLAGRMMIVAWNWRCQVHHVTAMRKANDRELRRYGPLIRR